MGGVRVVGRHRKPKPDRRQMRLRVAGAVLLAGSACVHLTLYMTGYRSIPTIGWLFLVQFIVGFVLAAGALVTYSRLAAAAGAAFALSTLSAYLLAVRIGLFGFREIRTRAGIAAGLIEVAAFATLALAAMATASAHSAAGAAGSAAGAAEGAAGHVSLTARVRAWMQAAASMVIVGVGAVSVLALALFGVAVADAATPPPAAPAGARVTLNAAQVDGVTVLTNASGRTLYWFAPDTPTTSRCTGSCAAYWPPVSGTPRAGPGVTGKLGTITRPGGGVQATYDGHPLYTYIGDSGPGQAQGNGLDLNGGLWYEVRVAG
jgi:predicted lipoprotein with Yx(FWY)xxD motif